MNLRTTFFRLVLITGLGLSMLPASRAEIEDAPDKKPVPLRTPPPALAAHLARESGIVLLAVVVDESGAVSDASIAKSTNAQLDAPSLKAIKKWKFAPAEKDGHPVMARMQIPLQYDGY